MKILWLFLILHTVFGANDLGSSYLKNSKLCFQWNCINGRLGMPDGLPSKEQCARGLRSLLPPGAWQRVVGPVLDTCYGDSPRRYTNTCPGQALMHCVADQLIQNCPEESLRRDDACAPLSSIAGFKYMFSQSRYENLERNLPSERRPSWFLKNYFSSKCCDLPELFERPLLAECGFTDIVHYYTHEPRPDHGARHRERLLAPPIHKSATDRLGDDIINNVDIRLLNDGYTPRPVNIDTFTHKFTQHSDTYKVVDPIDCCDVSEFIQPSWRSDCDFRLSWAAGQRLVVGGGATNPTTTTPPPATTQKYQMSNDVKVVPLECEKETCVFRKLNIVSASGAVDVDAFSKLLDNMTSLHEEWTKAKARVVTNCLTIRPPRGAPGVDDCEINRVLTCTFDVLSENCPHVTKNDTCRRWKGFNNGSTCQISASKYRPKHRRQFCGLPSLVDHTVLSECGVSSLSRMSYVTDSVTRKPWKSSWWSTSNKYNRCKDTTDSTKCLLNKMGVLNKYGFMDYFKMKDRIRSFTSDQVAWTALSDIYMNSFTSMPLYRDQCSSPKKLLNVLDSMLVTCPVSKRKYTHQCKRMFADISNTAPGKPFANEKHGYIWRQYNHDRITFKPQTDPQTITPKPKEKSHKKYDHSYINANYIPSIRTMDIKPQSLSKPLVLLPVYIRNNRKGQGNLSAGTYRDDVFRSDPFALHNNIAMAHTTDGVVRN